MPVFIAHSSADDNLANQVYNRLQNRHSIDCYIDDIDSELSNRRGNPALTQYLVDKLGDCDTLLAIVTANTKNSWWVPFEIGTAREMPRVIASFTNLPDQSLFFNDQKLPEYLLEWPRMRSESDLDVFAVKYKKTRFSALFEASESASYSNFQIAVEDVRAFESSVMRELNQ